MMAKMGTMDQTIRLPLSQTTDRLMSRCRWCACVRSMGGALAMLSPFQRRRNNNGPFAVFHVQILTDIVGKRISRSLERTMVGDKPSVRLSSSGWFQKQSIFRGVSMRQTVLSALPPTPTPLTRPCCHSRPFLSSHHGVPEKQARHLDGSYPGVDPYRIAVLVLDISSDNERPARTTTRPTAP